MNKIIYDLLYWGIWIIIPLIWEIFVGLIAAFIVILRKRKLEKCTDSIDYYPPITILIPVYNSENTLEMCLQSIINSNYPKDKIEIYLIDNGSVDNSRSIFEKIQNEYLNLKMWWLSSAKGKSKALNKGIFSGEGKYIINIDSDGWLDKNALINIVKYFETNDQLICATGVVLIDTKLIEKTKGFILKMIRLCELFEYVESFLIGRNYQSYFNSMYTLAGAFSAFRKENISRSQMYNFETVGEDTHMTFQMRQFFSGRIELCNNAFLFVDPIENLNKLYTQRQRWQRGQIEVAKLFEEFHFGNMFDFIKKFSIRILLSDHAMIFPRLIWLFGMVYLYFINYPLKLIIGANLCIYAAYVVNSLIYVFISNFYLDEKIEVKKYLNKHFYISIIMPFYRFILFWIRLAGIINSLSLPAKWKVLTFSEEINILKKYFVGKLDFIFKLQRRIHYK